MRGEGRGGRHRLRADYRAFPSRAFIFQIDNVVGLGDQPGDFHMKRCFPSEINGCYYSLTFILLSKPCLACCQRCEQSSKEIRQTEKCVRSAREKEHVALRGTYWHESRILRTKHYIINKGWGLCIIYWQ